MIFRYCVSFLVFSKRDVVRFDEETMLSRRRAQLIRDDDDNNNNNKLKKIRERPKTRRLSVPYGDGRVTDDDCRQRFVFGK